MCLKNKNINSTLDFVASISYNYNVIEATILAKQKKKMEEKTNEAIKMFIYGDPGVGKTHFCATAILDERTSPVLWLDLEGGTRTFRSKVNKIEISNIGNPQPGMIDVVRLRSWSDIVKIYEYLFKVSSGTKLCPYKTVVLDSLTEINDMALNKILGESNAKRLEPDVPEIRDYLKTNNLMKKLLRALRDLEDLNVFLTAIPKLYEDKAASIEKVVPALIGKLSIEAVSLYEFGVYLRYNRIEKAREMLFDGSGKIVAKRRDEEDFFSESLLDPTVSKFLDIMEGNNTIEATNAKTKETIKTKETNKKK